ncbi:hypothetical protein CLAIMM_15109, partial [Cladophialophora immunda]
SREREIFNHSCIMLDVALKIQGIEEVLKKLVILVDTHASSGRRPLGAKPHKRRQSHWTEIRSMISELATSVQNLKEKVEGSAIVTSQNGIAGAGGPQRYSGSSTTHISSIAP